MSKLVSLGQAPKSFSRTPKFTDFTGGKLEVDVEFVYMSPVEHGELLDALDAEAETKAAEMSTADRYRAKNMANAEYLLRILKGWGLEEPLNRDNLIVFVGRYPASVHAIAGDFYTAIHEGHAGN